MKPIDTFLQEGYNISYSEVDLKRNKKEFEVVAQLLLKLWKVESSVSNFKPFKPDTIEVAREALQANIQNNHVCIVAFANHKPIGFIIGTQPFKGRRRGNISNLYVEEQFRLNGIGRTLVNMCMKWLKSQGVDRVSVGVTGGNEKVIKFYSKFGFRLNNYVLSKDI